jgi:chromosome segregation ATPase
MRVLKTRPKLQRDWQLRMHRTAFHANLVQVKKPTDLTVEILKSIRDEVKKTNGRLDALRGEIDTLRTDTNSRFEELGRRIVESETRTATALTDLAGTVREMTSILKNQADLRPRVEKCELEIAELNRRVPKAS